MQAGLRGPIVGAVNFQLPAINEESEAVINFSASGDNTIIAGVSLQTVRVFRIFFVCSAATNITIKDGAGTSLTGAMSMAANGGFTLDTSGRPWFTTAAANAGSNRVAFAVLAWDGATGAAVTAITYGGSTMTSCGTRSSNTLGTDEEAEIFYLINPPTGSNTLAVTISNSPTEVYAGLVSFTGVNQTTPVRPGTYQGPANAQSNGGNPNFYTLTLTSNVNDLTMTVFMDGTGGTSTNQTQSGSNTAGTLEMFSDYATTPASSVAHTWTMTPNIITNVAIAGFSIQAVASAVTPVCPSMGMLGVGCQL